MNSKPHIKVNSKWITDINVKPETTKILEENIGECFCDLEFSNYYFFRQDIKITNHKQNIDKMDFIKIKIFSSKKHIVKKMKMQAIDREKIVKYHMSDEELKSRIHK